MDVIEFLDYHSWADKKIIESIKQISDSDLIEKNGDVRSIRELLEHYITSYDYLILPYDKLKERGIKLSKFTLAELLSEVSKNNKKFREIALNFDEVMKLDMWQGKSANMDKDNYLLLFLDHLTYHRGQITHAIKIKGYPGVNTDYYDFLEKVKHAD